jgi:hypothetical protein
MGVDALAYIRVQNKTPQHSLEFLGRSSKQPSPEVCSRTNVAVGRSGGNGTFRPYGNLR